MRIVGTLLSPDQSPMAKLQTAFAAAARYAIWYPQQWLYWSGWPRHAALGPRLAGHQQGQGQQPAEGQPDVPRLHHRFPPSRLSREAITILPARALESTRSRPFTE